MIKQYAKTIQISMRGQINGGILYLLPNITVKLLYLIPFMFLWYVLADSGVDAGMTLRQMMTYTLIHALLADLMVVQTFLSSWCYEGELQKLYTSPLSIFGDTIAETIGTWIPHF